MFFGALLEEVVTQKANTAPRTWEEASQFLKKSLAKHFQIQLEDSVLDDGIGASRYNLLKPKQVSDLLKAIYKDPSLAKIFIQALPQNGMSGTLKARMSEPSLKGKVRAKTGSLKGVSNIAGYVRTSNRQTMVFAIMMSNFTGSPKKYKDLQDQIIKLIHASCKSSTINTNS